MRKVLRGIGAAVTLFFMLTAYLAGGLLLLVGVGFADAKAKNPKAPADYTKTYAFRAEITRMLDGLYEAVAENHMGNLPEKGGAAYFAFGLQTNRISASDENALDLNRFEAIYKESPAYHFYVHYSSGVFRGFVRQGGVKNTFEIPYAETDGALFTEQRDYPGAVLVLALTEPAYSFSKTGFARLEFRILEDGVTLLFLLSGTFFVAGAVVFSAGNARRRINRAIAGAISWIYWEVRVAVLIFAGIWVFSAFSLPLTYPFLLRLLAVAGPVLYLFACHGLYAGRAFFAPSLIGAAVAFVKRRYDSIFPVLPLQIRLRQRLVLLFILGLVLPMGIFFLADVLLSAAVVRLMIPFYLFYFAALLAVFAKQYGELANGVSELTRYSALLPKGGTPPANPFSAGHDLFELAENMGRIEDAIAASTEKTFAEANRRLSDVALSLEELKERLSVLAETAEADECNPEETLSVVRRMQAVTEEMTKTLAQGSPINAPILKRIDLLAVLDDVMNARLVELSAARLSFESVLPKPPAFITADMLHIRAALDILVCNLAKHAQADSAVQIKLREKDALWQLTLVNKINDGAESAVRTPGGLLLAEEYLHLNGGTVEIQAKDGWFGVSVVLPRAH